MTDVVTSAAAAVLAEPAAPVPPAAPGVAAPAVAAPVPPAAAPAAPAAAPAAPAAPALTLPGKDADATAWKAFYKAIGAPENAQGYELPVAEGQDPAFAKEAAGWMAEAGLLPHQAKALAEKWNAHVASLTEAQKTAATQAETAKQTQIDTSIQTDQTAVKNEWQGNYDANMKLASEAGRQFLEPAFGKDGARELVGFAIEKFGWAKTTKMLHSLGKGLAEGTARGLDGAQGNGAARDPAQVLYGPKT